MEALLQYDVRVQHHGNTTHLTCTCTSPWLPIAMSLVLLCPVLKSVRQASCGSGGFTVLCAAKCLRPEMCQNCRGQHDGRWGRAIDCLCMINQYAAGPPSSHGAGCHEPAELQPVCDLVLLPPLNLPAATPLRAVVANCTAADRQP